MFASISLAPSVTVKCLPDLEQSSMVVCALLPSMRSLRDPDMIAPHVPAAVYLRDVCICVYCVYMLIGVCFG